MRIAVVGSGMAGAGAAYHAAGLGAEVVVVDRADAGQATAAGAGIVCPWASRVTDPHWFRLAADGARAYPPLVAELHAEGFGDLGHRQVGALAVAADPDALEQVRDRVLERRSSPADTGEVTLLGEREARALFPPLAPGLPALHVAGAARVDGRRIRDALLRGARRRGAELRPGRAVLVRSGTRVTGVEVDGARLDADAVVAAAGAWTRQLLAPLGLPVAVEPQRGQIAHLSLPDADTSRWPVVLPQSSGHYLVPFDDARVVAGATRETGAGFDHRVTAGGLAEVLREALAVAPGLADAAHLETRVGFRPAAADIRPLLGPVPGVEGLVVATGFGATGLTMGPWAGRLAALAALGEDPGLDLTPYDPVRAPGAGTA